MVSPIFVLHTIRGILKGDGFVMKKLNLAVPVHYPLHIAATEKSCTALCLERQSQQVGKSPEQATLEKVGPSM